MILLFMSFLLRIFVAFLVLCASLAINIRGIKDREKISPFECGFDPKGSARIPFSLRFFVLAVIFLVFDIEIALLIPLPLIIGWSIKIEALLGGIIFILILILGLIHEWREGSLDWSE